MDFKNLNVLIIDDVKVVRSALSKALNKVDIIQIADAENITNAWEIINSQNIDLIFCDWNMDDGDGIDLLRRLRNQEDPSLKFKKFIMVTGAKDKAYLAMDAGAHNIIHKPFDVETIKTKLELLYS